MRILFTSDPEIPVPPILYGGIQRIIFQLANFCIENGDQVGIVAHPDSNIADAEHFFWPGLTSQNPTHSFRNALKLKAAVKSFKPEAVHSFSRLQYLLPIFAEPLAKIMSYQREPSLKTTRLGKRLIRNLHFTGCSQYICNLGARNEAEWRCIYNFVDTDKIAVEKSVGQNAPLVFLSRLDHVKGAHVAIEVAKRTEKALILAGNRPESGVELDYYNAKVKPHIDDQLITYVGPVNDQQKFELLKSALALCLPIQWDEPFGIVFAEALACGTPIITCPRGAATEIVRDGIEGYLCNTIEEMEKAVVAVANIDREKCRARAEHVFSKKVVCQQYRTLYKRLIEGV